jgi:AcrR family transcriptional regulator
MEHERHEYRQAEAGHAAVDREEYRALAADRRDRRRAQTRDEILAAARELLLERGADGLSLREVARRAGFSPAALYKYFSGKDEVIAALAESAMGALLSAFGAVPRDLPPDRRAVELGVTYLDFARAHVQDVAVIEVHEAALPLDGEHAAVEDTVFGVFRDGVATGLFTEAGGLDAESMAYGAWALVQGLARLERSQGGPVGQRLRAHRRQLLWAYIDGLRTERSESGRTTPAAGGTA